MSANWGTPSGGRRRRTPLWPPVVVYVCGCVTVIAAGLAMIGLDGR